MAPFTPGHDMCAVRDYPRTNAPSKRPIDRLNDSRNGVKHVEDRYGYECERLSQMRMTAPRQ